MLLNLPVLSDGKNMKILLDDFDIVHMVTCSIPHTSLRHATEFRVIMHVTNRRQGKPRAYTITKNNGMPTGVMDIFRNRVNNREIGNRVGRLYRSEGVAIEFAHASIGETFAHPDLPCPVSGCVPEQSGFVDKQERSNLFPITRGRHHAGIELRLFSPVSNNTGVKRQES